MKYSVLNTPDQMIHISLVSKSTLFILNNAIRLIVCLFVIVDPYFWVCFMIDNTMLSSQNFRQEIKNITAHEIHIKITFTKYHIMSMSLI